MHTRIWFDPPMFRWSRVLGAAVLGVVITVAWLAHQRGLWPGDERPAQPHAVAAASAVAMAPSQPALRVIPAVVVAPAPASAPRAELRPAPLVTVNDDCSLGAKGGGTDARAGETMPEAHLAATRSRWFAALQAQSDPAVRAAGLLWQLRAPGTAASETERSAARDQLARLAVDSGNATVYGIAMLGCDGRPAGSPAGACQLLSTEQWLRVDADNAAVWLVQAERAAPGSAAQADALQRAIQAGRMKMPGAEVLPLVRRAMPTAIPDLERSALSRELLAVQAALPAPIGGATSFCSRANLADANRRGECEALATMLVERGAVLPHLIAGRAVAENLGWPAERLAALRKESELLTAMTVVPADETFSCRSIDRRTQRALDAARDGELPVLRRELQAAPRSADLTASRP